MIKQDLMNKKKMVNEMEEIAKEGQGNIILVYPKKYRKILEEWSICDQYEILLLVMLELEGFAQSIYGDSVHMHVEETDNCSELIMCWEQDIETSVAAPTTTEATEVESNEDLEVIRRSEISFYQGEDLLA
jgi:hypothetical protein